ncbi:response regulator transcription factor [Prosthecodimorpha staleyi]|uniref:Response regulator transcription factor n=1 Tax=Prosthecodimorpha staleyi TaxID=2840188 RepID=A0A947D212_9HYPH|nr:response regulator transcription factor [Prosthecodimorpha staleyi]MBT9289515.1 response regulator transcription factor [Prosthecodimorpha staleyi]
MPLAEGLCDNGWLWTQPGDSPPWRSPLAFSFIRDAGVSFPVLVVDDDPITREVYATACRQEGFEVHEAATVAEARNLCLTVQPSVVVLDLVLPDASGLEIIRTFRDFRFGILVVSARGEPLDRIVALELGADDFLVKPVVLREMVVRVRRIRERLFGTEVARVSDVVYRFGPFRLDLKRQELTVDGKPVELTRGQFRLLELFVDQADAALTRAQISIALHGHGGRSDNRSVDVLVSKLRTALSAHGGEDYLKSVRGLGYRFAVPVETVSAGPTRGETGWQA